MTVQARDIKPSTGAEFAVAVAAITQEDGLVIASSAMSFGSPLMSRIGVFRYGESGPELVHNGFVGVEDVEAVRAALGAGQGGWDAMFATDWGWAWREEPFELWHRKNGRVAAVEGRALVTNEGRFEWADIEHIEVWASNNMVDRGLRATRFDEPPVNVVFEQDYTPDFDPGYDREYLDADTLWMQVLGKLLAGALAKPYFCEI